MWARNTRWHPGAGEETATPTTLENQQSSFKGKGKASKQLATSELPIFRVLFGCSRSIDGGMACLWSVSFTPNQRFILVGFLFLCSWWFCYLIQPSKNYRHKVTDPNKRRHKGIKMGEKNSSCKQGNLTGLSVLVVSRPNQEIKAHLVVQTKKIILIELKARRRTWPQHRPTTRGVLWFRARWMCGPPTADSDSTWPPLHPLKEEWGEASSDVLIIEMVSERETLPSSCIYLRKCLQSRRTVAPLDSTQLAPVGKIEMFTSQKPLLYLWCDY